MARRGVAVDEVLARGPVEQLHGPRAVLEAPHDTAAEVEFAATETRWRVGMHDGQAGTNTGITTGPLLAR